jgi:hypothetical protein
LSDKTTPAPFIVPSLDTNTPSQIITPTLVTENATYTRDSKIPICKVDANGFFISGNDPRYIAPATVIVESSEITFGDAEDTLGNIDNYLSGISTGAEALGSLEALSKFQSYISGFGQVAAVANTAIAILGPLFGLKSQDDILFEAITEGFRQVNSRLDTIQFEMRAGFLDVSILIGDVALDELASRLTAHQRAFNTYANATGATRSLYEPRWRAICNAPFLSPEDLFYDLYGYVCESCTFASRKRADLLTKAEESNPISGSRFFDTFAYFMLRGMAQATSLHSLCLPPVEGACADRASDSQWNDGIATMQKAMEEAIQRISNVVNRLNDWVPNIANNHAEIDEIVKANKDNYDNVAKNILDFFVLRQPDYDFQILVYPSSNRNNYWRSFPDPFVTVTSSTGHLYFELEGMDISIRYRLKFLPPPSTTVTLGDQTISFPEFHQMTIKRLVTVEDANIAAADVEGGCVGRPFLGIGGSNACTVDHCFQCNPEEQAAFDSIVGYFFIRREGFDVKEVSTNPDSFPFYDAVFELTYFESLSFFPLISLDVFRFYYA